MKKLVLLVLFVIAAVFSLLAANSRSTRPDDFTIVGIDGKQIESLDDHSRAVVMGNIQRQNRFGKSDFGEDPSNTYKGASSGAWDGSEVSHVYLKRRGPDGDIYLHRVVECLERPVNDPAPPGWDTAIPSKMGRRTVNDPVKYIVYCRVFGERQITKEDYERGIGKKAPSKAVFESPQGAIDLPQLSPSPQPAPSTNPVLWGIPLLLAATAVILFFRQQLAAKRVRK